VKLEVPASLRERLWLPQIGQEQRPPPSGNLVPLIVTGAVLLTIAIGLIAKSRGVYWGAAGQPLTVLWDPVFTWWLLLAAGVLAGCLLLAFALLRSGAGPVVFGTALFGLALVSRVFLNLTRTGPEELYASNVVRPVTSGRLEYLSAMKELQAGVGPFLDRFAEMVPTLPLHVAGHPPGLVLTLDIFGLDTPEAMSALTIILGAAATPLLYVLVRRLYDEHTARVASLLFVFVPTMLLYGASAADALFVTLALAAVVGLLSTRRVTVAFGAFLLAFASFFSYALLAAGGWAGLVRWRRDGFRSMLAVALLCGAMLVAFYGLLAVFTGFDVVAAIDATHDRYYKGVASVRPYLFYFFGSPAAFLIMLGPVAWLAARSLGSREISAVALAAAILVIVTAGYTKAETERIWMFLVPFACIAAARALPPKWVSPVLVALTAQAVVIQVLFDTVW
jgi:hypothetical protein